MNLFGQKDDLYEPERTRYSAQTAHSVLQGLAFTVGKLCIKTPVKLD